VWISTTKQGETQPEIFYYQNDHLGTPQQVIDSQGNIVWSQKSTAFGETSIDESSRITNNLRFPGQYFDEETHTNYNFFRNYGQKEGRYGQTDPIGLEGGFNTYAYVDGNPLNNVDPSGLLSSKEGYDHYMRGSDDPKDSRMRTPIFMLFDDVDTSSVRPTDFSNVRKIIESCKKGECCGSPQRTTVDDKISFTTSGDQYLLLGDITLRLQGEIEIDPCTCCWNFQGTLKSFDDLYDFNKSTHRKLWAEIITILGGIVKGKPYWFNIRGWKILQNSGCV
jgi:RHS repeat-associated protein